jgi:hypothetical protein
LLAVELCARQDDTHRRAGELVGRLATTEGSEVRRWLLDFKAEQEAAQIRDDIGDDARRKFFGYADPGGSESAAELERADDTWTSSVIVGDDGFPQKIEVLEYIDSLAFWVASHRRTKTKPWKRSKQVAGTAEKLANLLDAPDCPVSSSVIELFDRDARPVVDGIAITTFRQQVSFSAEAAVDRRTAQEPSQRGKAPREATGASEGI